VHQYGLEKQWMERIVDELGIPASDIGIIGGGKFRIRPVTIGIQKSIFNIMEKGGEEADELRRTFGLVIGDEIQLFAARTFIGCIDPFPAKYRLGISADETRADRKEFLIYDLFGKVAADIPKERVLEQGAIVDVEIRVYPTDFKCPEYSESYRPDFNLLLERMKYDVARNEVVMNAIAEARKLGTVMVFSHRIDHCHLIDSMCAEARIKSGLMIGSKEWASAFDATKLGLKQGTLDVAIGTIKAIGQGLDIPSVNSGVVTTPLAGGKGKQQFGQVRGRICRASHGKSVGFIHYIWDRHIVGIAALRNLIRWNTKVVVLNDGVWVDAKRYVQLLRKSLTDFSKGGM
jgi:superfamily II DNA or RNA helicase